VLHCQCVPAATAGRGCAQGRRLPAGTRAASPAETPGSFLAASPPLLPLVVSGPTAWPQNLTTGQSFGQWPSGQWPLVNRFGSDGMAARSRWAEPRGCSAWRPVGRRHPIDPAAMANSGPPAPAASRRGSTPLSWLRGSSRRWRWQLLLLLLLRDNRLPGNRRRRRRLGGHGHLASPEKLPWAFSGSAEGALGSPSLA
jgi:hypothetical protein